MYSCGNLDSAADLYARAHKLVPSSEDALLGLSLLALSGGDYKRAANWCSEILTLNPQNLLARKRLAYVHFLQGRLFEAQAGYEQVMEQAPTDVDARLGLAWIALRQARRFEALSLAADIPLEKGKELREEIGQWPDFGLIAYFTGLGYLDSPINSHSLGLDLYGFINYQDLLTVIFHYNHFETWRKSIQPPAWVTWPVPDGPGRTKHDNFNPQVLFKYGIFGLHLGYSRLEGRGGSQGGKSPSSFTGHFLFDFGRVGFSAGGSWSMVYGLKVLQIAPEFVFELNQALSFTLTGGIQHLWQQGPLNHTNYLSLELGMEMKMSAGWKLNGSIWSGKRIFWVDRLRMIPHETLDLFYLGFRFELVVDLWKHLGIVLGVFGQFGTDVNNINIDAAHLGGFAGVQTVF